MLSNSCFQIALVLCIVLLGLPTPSDNTGTNAQMKKWDVTSPQIFCSRAEVLGWTSFPCSLRPAGWGSSTVGMWRGWAVPTGAVLLGLPSWSCCCLLLCLRNSLYCGFRSKLIHPAELASLALLASVLCSCRSASAVIPWEVALISHLLWSVFSHIRMIHCFSALNEKYRP